MPKQNDDTEAPRGLDLNPNPSKHAAWLSKKPLLVGGGVLATALVVALAGLSSHGHHASAQSGESTNVVPAHDIPRFVMPPPAKPKPVKPAASPKAGSSATSSKSGKKPSASAPASPPVNHSPAPSASVSPGNHRPSVRQKAAEKALSGSMGTSWQHGGQSQAGKKAASTSSASKSGAQKSVYDANVVRRPASPYELQAGSDIPATLTTSIQSDLPGQIRAVVSRNVFDSEAGRYLLIPAGAKIVGFYSNKVIAGQTRVGVEWTRIIFPNGSYMKLGKMPGASPSGKDGLHDLVNNHTWKIFKNALLMSVVDLGISVSQPGYGSAGGYGQQSVSPAQQGEASLMQTFGQAESNILQRYTNIAPTLTIRAGYQLNVAVTHDLVFPGPYKPGAAAQPESPRGLASASRQGAVDRFSYPSE